MTRHRSWHVPTWLERLGRASWLAIGIILLLAGVMVIFSLTRTILVPLILATLGAAVCLPLVDRLTRMRIPRGIAALIVLLVLLVAGAAIVILVISQIVGQAAELQTYLAQGLQQLQASTLGPQLQTIVDEATALLQEQWQQIIAGIVPFVATSVSAIISLGFGIFIAINILYYLLVDGRRAGTWLGEHVGLPPELGVQIVRHGVRSLRGYFTGATIVAAFNGLVIGVTAVILGTPMAGVIALVNFLFSYIPYVGAIVGGAVAVILALASGDPMDGVYMLIVVIAMNTVLQTVVMAVAMGATLKLHPLVVLLATTVGGIFAGAIGSALGAPIVAVAVDSLHRVRDSRLFSDDEEKADAGDSPADEPASPPKAAGDATSASPA
jgi:predicted PurR-regulated permease PerM